MQTPFTVFFCVFVISFKMYLYCYEHAFSNIGNVTSPEGGNEVRQHAKRDQATFLTFSEEFPLICL